jgi:cob(I)alamin adenosyltransferase
MSEMVNERGYFQIYTGNGKGKTTAALGLVLRAAGAGKMVLFTQFLKTKTFSEHKALECFSDLIAIHCFGTGDFIRGEVRPEHREAAQRGYAMLCALMEHHRFSVVVCDEIITALNLGLLTKEQVLVLSDRCVRTGEVVFTGRCAPEYLIEHADLVTEMVEVKHYYSAGVVARRGIEY